MFYPFCIIRSRKPCKTQRTGFPLFLPFSKLSEMPVQSYLRILQGISTQNEFLRFVPFLPFLKSSETPVRSYLNIFYRESVHTMNFFGLCHFCLSRNRRKRRYDPNISCFDDGCEEGVRQLGQVLFLRKKQN